MRILILFIFSRTAEYYNQMLEIQRKYVHKYENVDAYFIQGSYEHNEEVFFDNDIVHVRCHEEHNTILYKTLCTMDTLKNFYKKEYTFTIRTNISTIINIPKMIELLNLFTYKEYIYAGDICGITKENRHIQFALGTCIILSTSLANKMIDEKYNFNNTLEDDVAMGLFVQDYCNESFNHNLSTGPLTFYTNTLVNGCNSNVNDFINHHNTHKINYIFYRNKLNDRYEDAKVMNYICDNIL